MKKKILLGVILAVAMMCLFAIAISAVEINGVHYTLTDSNLTAKVSTDNRTATTEIVVIPSTVEYDGKTYQVTSIDRDAFYGNRNVVELRILSEYITTIPASMIADTYGKDTDGDNIIDKGDKLKKIYIDFSKITSIGSAAFNPSDQTNGNAPKTNSFYFYDAKAFIKDGSDVKITCPDFSNCTSIGSAAFQGANFEKLVIHADLPLDNQVFRCSTIKELDIKGANRGAISYYVFNSCKSLETIRVEGATSISNDVFSGCSAVKEIYINLSNCTSVAGSAFSIGNKGYDQGNTQTQWYNYQGEKIVDLSSVKSIGNQSFSSSNVGSAKIIWPTALDSISNQAFRRCNITDPVIINMSAGKETIVPDYFLAGNTPSIIVCGNGVKGMQMDGGFKWDVKIIFLEDTITTLGTDRFKTAGAEVYAKTLPSEASAYGSNVTINYISSGSYRAYGACGLTASVTLTGGATQAFNYVSHNYKGVADQTVCPAGSLMVYTCAGCNDTYNVEGENYAGSTHEYNVANGATIVAIVFDGNNYFVPGVTVVKCAHCVQETNGAEFSPLFIAVGYSSAEEMNGYVSHTVKVNLEAIEEYKKITGIDVQYGVVAAQATDGKPLQIVEGKVATVGKSVAADMTGTSYSTLVIKINGITDNSAFNCNAYAVVNNEITYLCGEVATDTAVSKSLNIVAEATSSVELAPPEEIKQYA